MIDLMKTYITLSPLSLKLNSIKRLDSNSLETIKAKTYLIFGLKKPKLNIKPTIKVTKSQHVHDLIA
jgi:hypothetical protein